MSFRSRTRSKPVVPVRRSTSLTRPSASSGNARPYTPSSGYSGYQSGSGYLNPYHSSGLEASSTSYSPRNSGYFDYGIGASGGSGNKRRESYGSNTSLNALMYSNPLAQNPYTYKSPYKDRDRYGNNSTSTYTSPYSNRYVSPYSTYENGVTTAGLSFHAAVPGSSGSNLTPTSKLSTSNTSLNHYLSPTKTTTAHLARSASLRDQERKSRNRNRKQQASTTSQTPTPRSLSVSSVHSDIGYESGGESGRVEPKDDSSENGEFIDYKALYEAEKAENDKLKAGLRKKDDELATLKSALERFTNATTKNTLSEIEKRERRAMERKISEMEEELKQLQKFKNENERLRAENRALTRVVSKLTTSAQNQLHHHQQKQQ